MHEEQTTLDSIIEPSRTINETIARVEWFKALFFALHFNTFAFIINLHFMVMHNVG